MRPLLPPPHPGAPLPQLRPYYLVQPAPLQKPLLVQAISLVGGL